MTWIEFADQHFVGLSILTFFALIALTEIVEHLAQAWKRRGDK